MIAKVVILDLFNCTSAFPNEFFYIQYISYDSIEILGIVDTVTIIVLTNFSLTTSV